MILSPPIPDVSVIGKEHEIKGPVERLILASCLEELNDEEAGASNTVVFFTDWLAWVEWRKLGGKALHAESFLASWPEELGDEHDFQQRATRWMYRDGVDLTSFCGVSLGKQLNWEVTGLKLAHGRLEAALGKAISALEPRRVEYRGLRVEYDFLSQEWLLQMAATVAAAHGAEFQDARRPLAKAPVYPELPFNGEFAPAPWYRRLGLRAIELITDTLSRLAALAFAGGPRIFIIHNLILVNSLLETLPMGKVTPVLLASMYPKRPAFLIGAWRKGVKLVAMPRAKLDREAKSKIAEIRHDLRQYWAATQASGADQAVRDFVERHLLAPGALEALALSVLKHRKLLLRERPHRLLAGDSENTANRMLCEIARTAGIGADELPNGMFLTRQRMDCRSGDGVRGPVIDQLLAWGRSGKLWADAAHVGAQVVETGYPVAEALTKRTLPGRGDRSRLLFLPLHIDKTDLRGLHSEVFANLVRCVAVAAKMGYREIRIKVHPGFVHLDYFQEIARRFSLNVDIVKDGPLLPHIEWADLVVGPVNSGAMVETAALGRPYLSMLNPPTSLASELAAPARQILPKNFDHALSLGLAEDNAAILSEIAGIGSGESASARVWAAIIPAAQGSVCRTCA